MGTAAAAGLNLQPGLGRVSSPPDAATSFVPSFRATSCCSASGRRCGSLRSQNDDAASSPTWKALVGALPPVLLIASVAPGPARARRQVARSRRRTIQRLALEGAEGGLLFDELERTDPGRSDLRVEWARGAEVSFEETSGPSGLVRIYSAPSADGGSWRRLRFNDVTEQSVVRLDADGQPVRAALPFGYLKTLAAVGICTARALGRASPPRVLVIGVGLGTLPAWLATEAGASVDAVELDEAVLRGAVAAMGLPAESVRPMRGASACVADAAAAVGEEAAGDALGSGRLRVYCCDGAEFVTAASAAKLAQYDFAIVDVFDGAGETPAAFVSREFADALGAVSACAVANLTCPVPMWEEAHEYNAPQAGALTAAWRAGFGPTAGVWSVRVAEGQNVVLAVTGVGAPPPDCLAKEAQAAAVEGMFAFDPVRRVAFKRREWP